MVVSLLILGEEWTLAVVAVTADNNRFNNADTITDWGNINGGGGIATEDDIIYQGNASQSRKISTTLLGRDYDPGAGGVDMTAKDRNCWLMKITATNPGVLLARTAPALHARIGSGSAAYYDYYIAGSDTYPPRGGWLLIAIDPSVSGYRDATSGSPSLTAIDYFGVLADFSVGSKSQNVAIDALDIGAGLHLVGGDAGSTEGIFEDFVLEDEGDKANRWGYVFTEGGIPFVNGRLSIGEDVSESVVATEFTDVGKTVVWNNGYFATGFAKFRCNLGSASTIVDLTGCTFISSGEKDNTLGLAYTTTEDTRLQVEITGTSGTCTFTDHTFLNLNSISLTSATTIDGGVLEVESITQAGAEITGCTITTTAVTSIATLTDPTFGTTSDLHDLTFTQGGAGHAFEIDTAGSYTLTGIAFIGYGATGSNAAAIDITETTGTVTLNIGGTDGTTPTFKTAGATVVVNNSVTVTVTALNANDGLPIENARLLLEVRTGGDLPFEVSTTITRSGAVATATVTAHGLVTGDLVKIIGADQEEYNIVASITVTGANDFTYTVSGTPTTPATGTITTTSVILDDLTSAAGIVTTTAFNYTNDQDIIGRLRKGSSSPFYKTAGITGTITDTGFSANVAMVPDE